MLIAVDKLPEKTRPETCAPENHAWLSRKKKLVAKIPQNSIHRLFETRIGYVCRELHKGWPIGREGKGEEEVGETA